MTRPATLLLIAGALALAGCGGGSKTTSSASSAAAAPSTSTSTSTSTSSAPAAAGVTIDAKTVPGLGSILVNAQGKTIYMFAPDKHKKVTCTGSCAAVWPPVKLSSGAKPVAGPGVKQSLLGSDPDPAGGSVVTYHGWPLYLYVADTAPGKAAGQALNLNGGLWYVLSPSGKVITTKP